MGAVRVVVVFTGSEAVSVMVGASGERRAISLGWFWWCSARAWKRLGGRRARLLAWILTPTGIATTVGVWLAGGSGLEGREGMVQLGVTIWVRSSRVLVHVFEVRVIRLVLVVVMVSGVMVWESVDAA